MTGIIILLCLSIKSGFIKIYWGIYAILRRTKNLLGLLIQFDCILILSDLLKFHI